MTGCLSKSRMLQLLKPITKVFCIPKFISISAIDFKDDPKIFIVEIQKKFKCNVIVRSSASDEDGVSMTLAGEYESILNVDTDNTAELNSAINKVISSYEQKRLLCTDDEIIIQEMISRATMSGVVFTHDLNTGAPYYVVNYDDQSGLTDTVTSGEGKYANRTLYVYRNSIEALRSDRFRKLLLAVQELEQILENEFLDIEFALDEKLSLYLLQVRTITTQPSWNIVATKQIDSTLQKVLSFTKERFKKIPNVYGETTVLGQMPDWNPIEMIGRAPRALAASLYQILITDNAWRVSRDIMGYKVPTGQPLMVMLAGQPFIDVRLSFHSFLPKSLSSEISEKLVCRWVECLKLYPEQHDKVEFEIAITSYSFDIDDRIERLVGNVLTADEKIEFKQIHLQHTRKLIQGTSKSSIKHTLDKIYKLRDKYIATNSSNIQYHPSLLLTIVDDCINLGTIPFSILARHAFIAKTILLSLNHRGIITNDEINQIQANVNTVASELVCDMRSLHANKLSSAEFMIKYGHLRPGTYDIMSHRYDQMTDLFISGNTSVSLQIEQDIEPFEFSQKQQQQINLLLIEDGFDDFTANNLLDYIKESIVGREYGKFVFTRLVSDILEHIATLAENNNLSRDDISHVPFDMLLNVVKSSSEISIEKSLKDISEKEAKKHDVSVAIRLPQLLIDQAGVYVVPFQVSHPNFITSKKVTAPCIRLYSEIEGVLLNNKIVIIESADPGFDWIFSQKIAGLITKYGGANSHMAIRCAEFGIPAAIGCGEQRFDLLLKANRAHLDCAAGLINNVH